ncbi:hypothetical protein [Streptomyces himastatinicus]|nr:hypothetical protein [Streptomyces himastatinicus]
MPSANHFAYADPIVPARELGIGLSPRRTEALPGPYHLDQLADDLIRVVETFVAARRPAGLTGLLLVAPARRSRPSR